MAAASSTSVREWSLTSGNRVAEALESSPSTASTAASTAKAPATNSIEVADSPTDQRGCLPRREVSAPATASARFTPSRVYQTNRTAAEPLAPRDASPSLRHSRVESVPARLSSTGSSTAIQTTRREFSTRHNHSAPQSPLWNRGSYWKRFPRMPMIRVAKKLLSQLEALWTEVTGLESDEMDSPQDTTRTSRMNPSRSKAVSANFFLQSIPPDLRPLSPIELEEGPALNDEALKPIVKSLEKLIDEEMRRRDLILKETNSLEARFRRR
ncbi:hypothetical protein DFJ73DRAFT_844445 [Zopfochytrium polystomum]|nr:hypothetical protein DFJ73DRAFT_844445 [Zopfochytrium polystomum]